jgi:endonuclease/exonuclease/phosphatase (EEP) superfamily protein YafD
VGKFEVKKIVKILGWTLAIITTALLIGKNHFLLGTALNLLRWFLLTCLVFLFLVALKSTASTRHKSALLILTLSVLGEFFSSKFSESSLEDPLGSRSINIASYNLFFRNNALEPTLDIIDFEDMEILALQEFTPNGSRHVESIIGSKYKFRRTLALEGTHGLALYSKFPILESSVIRNEQNQPIALVVSLSIEGTIIQVINAHLASPAIAVENPDKFFTLYSENYELRKKQLSVIKQLVENEQEKYSCQILIGDLNTTCYEPIYRDALKTWQDLFSIAGTGSRANFPNSSKTPPFLQLDHIFLRGSVSGEQMIVLEGGYSDHLAVKGRFKL